MPFDHAEFTRDVREIVAQVPEQREPKIEEGQRIWLPDFDGGTLLVVEGVEPTDHGLMLTVTLDDRERA